MDRILRSQPYHRRLSLSFRTPQWGYEDFISIGVIGFDIDSVSSPQIVFNVPLVRTRIIDQNEFTRFQLLHAFGQFFPEKPTTFVCRRMFYFLQRVEEFANVLVSVDHFSIPLYSN